MRPSILTARLLKSSVFLLPPSSCSSSSSSSYFNFLCIILVFVLFFLAPVSTSLFPLVSSILIHPFLEKLKATKRKWGYGRRNHTPTSKSMIRRASFIRRSHSIKGSHSTPRLVNHSIFSWEKRHPKCLVPCPNWVFWQHKTKNWW